MRDLHITHVGHNTEKQAEKHMDIEIYRQTVLVREIRIVETSARY